MAEPTLDLCEVCGEGRAHCNHPAIAWIGAALPEGRHHFKSSLDALLAASLDEVDADLRRMGADPDAIRARGQAFFEQQIAVPEDALDLDALQRLCDAATPGPWDGGSAIVENCDGLTVCEFSDPAADASERDADFICAARDALPKLIARVRELEARFDECLDELEQEHPQDDGVHHE
jgi:hypothetical protein